MSVPTAPKTRVEIVTDTVHGVKIQDSYRWLEDQDSPETRKWLDEQMKYTRTVLDKTPGRDRIVKRLSELLRIDTMSPVANRGGRLFYWKRKAEQNQPVLFLREPSGQEKVLIDPNTMSADGQISASVFDVSPDGKLLAYALQSGGEDEVVVKFRDLDQGTDLSFELPKTRYWSLEIAPDKKDVYYVRYDSKGPRVLRQSLSNTAAPADLLFGDGFGEERGISASLSDDGKYLVMTASEGWATSDVYVYDIAAAKVKPVAVGLKERFEGVPGGDHLFLLTTWKSPGGRVLSVPFADARFEALKEIVPERQATLESLGTAGGKIVLNYLENASSKVRIHNPDGTLVRELQLPGIGTAQGPYGEWDQDEAWYGFASFGQPNTWYTYKISTAEQSVFFKPNVPLDPSQTEVTQVWVTSKKDKTKVPMFLFHKKGLKPNAQTPVQLYGYGGFNVSLTPTFSATNQVWVEMGGVYAVANLRGGGEFGEKWHKAGMFENKQNVFDDFESSAEWLIEHGYGSKKTMSINGGSNGGLLVGTAMTQRPDLFKAVVCQVPLLDMVRYHQFKVAKLWVPEYGSSEDPKQFEYIFKYSPYHHVKKGVQYPAVMFVTGDADTRVDPLHARKMTALVQANTGSQNPVLLHYDTKSGHAGGKPVNKAIEDSADILTFLSGQTGAKLP